VITLAVLPGLPAMKRIDARAFADGVAHRPASAHAHLHHHSLRIRHTR
jgi:hypothetical protein